MPKQTPSGSPCLNPIAHTFFEHPSVSQKRGLKVVDASRVQYPAIRNEVTHPASPYVIRLEMEGAVSAAPVASNFLVASTPTALPDLLDASGDLSVHAMEALAQQEVEPQLPNLSPRPDRVVHSAPVVDQLAVDDLIDQLEPEEKDWRIGGLENEGDAPLVTLDELLDDVALTEELVNLPAASQPPRRLHMPVRLPVGWTKTIALFVGLSFVLVLPIHAVTVAQNVGRSQGKIMAQGEEALASIQDGAHATGAQEFQTAASAFHQATSSFEAAQTELRSAKAQLFGLADVLPAARKTTAQARHLLAAGESMSRAAGVLTDGMNHVANRVSDSPTAAVSLFDVFAEQALPDLWNALDQLQSVQSSAIPAEHRSTLRSINQGVASLATSLQAFHDSADAIGSLLGHQKRQRYLILFQNNTELRPTGGFWGSFAEVDLLEGRVDNLSIPGGGTYDLQGQLTQHIAAPDPLQLIRGRWELQDANWYPDFPESARTAMWFYEQSGGPSVDGVIVVNADLVAKLIDAVGPIEMPEYHMTVDGETFLFQTQRQVEMDYDKEANTPKAFIGDLAPVLLDRITQAQQDTFLNIVELLGHGLSAQDIQIYHTDPGIQSAIERMGWDGAVRGNTGDYLLTAHTNIGGGKTDGVIDDDIAIESTVRADGRIENMVTISRTHHGIQTATFSGKNNVSFTRIYVPRDSTLLSVEGAQPPQEELFKSAEGLDAESPLRQKEQGSIDAGTGAFVGEGFGKTIFGDWMQTPPGATSTIIFRYLLPEDILDEPGNNFLTSALGLIGIPQTVRHSLFVQKQAGVAHRSITYQFNPGTAMRPVWSTNENVTQFSLKENADGFFGMVLERP